MAKKREFVGYRVGFGRDAKGRTLQYVSWATSGGGEKMKPFMYFCSSPVAARTFPALGSGGPLAADDTKDGFRRAGLWNLIERVLVPCIGKAWFDHIRPELFLIRVWVRRR